MTTLLLRQDTYLDRPTYRARISAILEGEPGADADYEALARRVGCKPATALRYAEEWRTRQRRGDAPLPGDAPRCRSCGCLEDADEPLGRGGACLACWWMEQGWNYYDYRTGRVSEEQRLTMAEEFGL